MMKDLRTQVLWTYRIQTILISSLMLVALFWNLKLSANSPSGLDNLNDLRMNLWEQIQWAFSFRRPDFLFGALALIALIAAPILRNFLGLVYYARKRQGLLVTLTLITLALVYVGVRFSIAE